MSRITTPRTAALVAALAGAAALIASPAVAAGGGTLWVDNQPAAKGHISEDHLQGQAKADALALSAVPTADWFTGGTPQQVRNQVHNVVNRAADAGGTPTLVAYNIPFRDCSQYSAGGATSPAAYDAWIDAFAAGIGNQPAIVILEPDGLGIIPFHTNLDGSKDWCQPAEADPATAESDRYAMLNHAVDALKAHPATQVFLDAGHSAWLNVGENASRLLAAGVTKADGFFLNASNYQFTENSVAYGHWISDCIALVTHNLGGYGDCGNQYWNGGPANGWSGVAMNNYEKWTSGNADPAANTAGVDSRYASQLGDVQPTAKFVVDTSRNGLGPWNPATSTYPSYPAGADKQDWCNPPGRGLGLRPTLQTGDPLVAGYLWIKVPGESDGSCQRGVPGTTDPERGMVDPAAGAWFPQQARELIANAVPALG
ncbi:MAG: glycoside hydrolase family 6 protein [Promicromonosporaceae bacterium]|nr:glycoside hydrolase family 6 protein [Promicromonosporaceae bacterium]